ncbi:sodium:solute symporter family protein [Amycolatopsis japonica]|uniref:sodium:solute symporter family protein n=1 Tax=Amycolatopsis japonica TaxID=208439 RepID=UPI0038152C46
MNTVLFVTIVGVVVIALCGFLGRRRPSADLAEWTVGGRNFGAATMWFLQAGEVFTTFTFLAVAGVAFQGGAAATYAIPYLPIAFIGCYFLVPRIWALGKDRGYLTQADFFADRYRSPRFGRLVAVIGVVFLLPYLQLQITGLGLVVELVTGSKASGNLSMVVSSVLTVAFVLWAGIRGLANAAYLKDFLMLFAMAVLALAVPIHFAGGIGEVFSAVARERPALLEVGSTGTFSRTWWLTSVLVSAIGVGCLTAPHQWPAYLSAKSEKTLRQNFVLLPIYQVVIILPVIVGFVGILALPEGTAGNGVLLKLANVALPDWLTGVIAVAAAASAMIPAGSLCMGISSLVARNIVTVRSERTRMRINHVVVVLAVGLSLGLALARPDLLANLLLLTFSGLAQLAPALLAAIGKRRLIGLPAAVAGLVTGVATLIWLTFGQIDLHGFNAGVGALVVNVAVTAVVELVTRGKKVTDIKEVSA